jgi:hypothetical protein
LEAEREAIDRRLAALEAYEAAVEQFKSAFPGVDPFLGQPDTTESVRPAHWSRQFRTDAF